MSAEQTMIERLDHVQAVGAHVDMHCARNGPAHGWHVTVTFDGPEPDDDDIVQTPFGRMRRVREGDEADLSADNTHEIATSAWDVDLPRAVERATAAFLAAYAASAAHAAGGMEQ